jgi:hypothetical protein
VDVSRENGKISILIHKDAFIAALIKMAHTPVAPVEVPRIADIKVSHEFTEVPQGSFEQKMEMIAHEDIAVELYSVYTQGLGKVLKEAFPVPIVPEDVFLFVSPTGHVIDGAWIL